MCRIRPAIRLALCATALPVAAAAQPLTWSELVSPDRVLRSAVQTMMLGLRSQVDVIWSGMAVDARAGTVTMRDLQVLPVLDHDRDGECAITAGRAQITLYDIDSPDLLQMRMRLVEVDADPACLPGPARMPLAAMGLEALTSPVIRLDIVYDVPSAGADVTLFGQIDGAASITLDADFDYLWFYADATDPEAEPEPDIWLDSARIEIENLGIWQVLSQMMPPPFTDPETGGMALAGMVQSQLPPDPAVAAFATELGNGWQAFLADPQRLVIETSVADPVYLDFEAYAETPLPLLADLQPIVGVAPAGAAEILPADVLATALESPDALEPEMRRAVALALATGSGAPMSRDAAVALLEGPASDGDAESAGLLAATLADRDPQAAYGWALTAGAVSVMDRLETQLDVAQILEAQDEAAPSGPSLDGASIADLRGGALAALLGRERPRSYRDAMALAQLGQAAGDTASAELVSELSARFAGNDAWDEAMSEAASTALDLWIAEDMPARFGPR